MLWAISGVFGGRIEGGTYPLYTFPKLPPPAYRQHGPYSLSGPAPAPTYALLFGVQRRGVHRTAHGEALGHGDPRLATVLPQQRSGGQRYVLRASGQGESEVRFARDGREGRCMRGRRSRNGRYSARVDTAPTGYATGREYWARVSWRWRIRGEAVGAFLQVKEVSRRLRRQVHSARSLELTF
jgi:hypothetical protein